MNDLNLDGKVTVSDYKINIENWLTADYEIVSNAIVNSSFGQFFEISKDGIVVGAANGIYFVFNILFEFIYYISPVIGVLFVLLIIWFYSKAVFNWIVKSIKRVPKEFKSFGIKNLVFQSGFVLSIIFLLFNLNALTFKSDFALSIMGIGIIIFLPLYLILLFLDALIDGYKRK